MTTWNVYRGRKLITTVFYSDGVTADEVKDGLVNHDGLPPDITVRQVVDRRRTRRSEPNGYEWVTGYGVCKK